MKKEFVVVVFNSEHEAFVVHITALSSDSSDKGHPLKKAQIACLKMDKALTEIFCKYVDFINIFSLKWAAKPLEYTSINNHTIELVDDGQLPYNSITVLVLWN